MRLSSISTQPLIRPHRPTPPTRRDFIILARDDQRTTLFDLDGVAGEQL